MCHMLNKKTDLNIAMRTFLAGEQITEEKLVMAEAAISDLTTTLATQHAEAMIAGEIDMIEIEFLDDPEDPYRFFRVGTNPAMMVNPLQLVDRKPS